MAARGARATVQGVTNSGKDCVNLAMWRDKTLHSSFAPRKESWIDYVPCALAAKQATQDIPIVIIAADPVETSIVPKMTSRLDYQKMETMAESARRVGSLSPSLT